MPGFGLPYGGERPQQDLVVVLRLSEFLGARVVDTEGLALGRLVDVVVRLEPHPRAVRLRIRRGLRRAAETDWEDVAAVDDEGARVRPGTKTAPATLADHELLLARHVLDAQIVDLTGKCRTRVGDVELSTENGVLSVAGVEVGAAPLLRRLGLSFLVREAEATSIRWADLRLTSERGRRVQLAVVASAPTASVSHAELLHSLVPEARRKRFQAHWIRRRGPT
jgi:sporulation protein YlmC with PRC-barrel domain